MGRGKGALKKQAKMGGGKKVLPPPEKRKRAMLTDGGKGLRPRGRRQIRAEPEQKD